MTSEQAVSYKNIGGIVSSTIVTQNICSYIIPPKNSSDNKQHIKTKEWSENKR